MPDDDFLAHLHELLDSLGPVATRAMFGGHGVYLDGTIIGLVIDVRLYLKTDAASAPGFAAAQCVPLVYTGKNGPVAMSYWSVPDDAMDSAEAMAPWARLALAAALRKQTAKASKRARPRKPQ